MHSSYEIQSPHSFQRKVARSCSCLPLRLPHGVSASSQASVFLTSPDSPFFNTPEILESVDHVLPISCPSRPRKFARKNFSELAAVDSSFRLSAPKFSSYVVCGLYSLGGSQIYLVSQSLSVPASLFTVEGGERTRSEGSLDHRLLK